MQENLFTNRLWLIRHGYAGGNAKQMQLKHGKEKPLKTP